VGTGLTVSILAAELLKVRKRWLPYLLLAVMLIGTAGIVWLGGYGSWRDERGEVEYGFGRASLHTFALPWSLPALLDTGQFYGAVLVSILVASAVATEHGWGTVRQALVRGQTRAQYLTAKLAGIVVIAAVMLLAALAVGLVFSLIATTIADQPVTFDVPGGPSFFEVVLMVLRAGYAIIPYASLAFLLAVVGRSTTLGVVGTLLYMLVAEAILIGVLGQLGGPADEIRASFIGHNAHALIAANQIGPGEYNSIAPREYLTSAQLPDPKAAALVLAGYSAFFLIVAYRVFQRRDLGTDAGGG